VPTIAIGSVLLIAVIVAVYAHFAPSTAVPSPQLAAALALPAYLYLLVVVAGVTATLADLLVQSRKRATALVKEGRVSLSPSSVGPYVLSQRRYWVVFSASALLYGILYSFLTGVVAYRPDISFAEFPGLVVPSVQPDQLIGAPLYVPEVTVFLNDHVALVLVPLTILLMVTISVLVGFNLALAAYAYDNRAKERNGSWVGQLGAVVGLFTGCPTCAGLYFFSLLGGSGAASFAVVLGYYQPLFVALCVPVLLAAPYLISRSLAKLFKDGCVVVSPGSHHRP